ncbi:Uncharacterized protein HZ326_21037 [Fusarium oxysporum f. sp. albedinis]|nr:Uncharacterized protein HZ326_21037 [Fusarium oxysporum f. sp. albedinis]
MINPKSRHFLGLIPPLSHFWMFYSMASSPLHFSGGLTADNQEIEACAPSFDNVIYYIANQLLGSKLPFSCLCFYEAYTRIFNPRSYHLPAGRMASLSIY